MSPRKLERVMDANLNRLREGLRVVEDVARYILDDASLASKIREVRHCSTLRGSARRLLCSRDIAGDVLAKSAGEAELRRESVVGVCLANFRRAQESSRVLEELLKIDCMMEYGNSLEFKSVRYKLYDLERAVVDELLKEEEVVHSTCGVG